MSGSFAPTHEKAPGGVQSLSERRVTGAPIWKMSPRKRLALVQAVCKSLESEYGMPRLGNPIDPLDVLVFITLSNRTTPRAAEAAYQRIKDRFTSWDEVVAAGEEELGNLIRPAGLSSVKSRQLLRALRHIMEDHGSCDLVGLSELPVIDILKYLVSLSGVSNKVARCVMLFGFSIPVLPVDAHVHRLASRLGWTVRRRPDGCHEELESLVPSRRRLGFHVDCIAHGRSICRARKPACQRCCIRAYCPSHGSVSH